MLFGTFTEKTAISVYTSGMKMRMDRQGKLLIPGPNNSANQDHSSTNLQSTFSLLASVEPRNIFFRNGSVRKAVAVDAPMHACRHYVCSYRDDSFLAKPDNVFLYFPPIPAIRMNRAFYVCQPCAASLLTGAVYVENRRDSCFVSFWDICGVFVKDNEHKYYLIFSRLDL